MILPNHKILDFFVRSLGGLLIGLVFAVILSETSFAMMDNKQTADRGPNETQIVIPYGTAEQVNAGVYNRLLPSDMVFVEGDVLIVKNEDVVDHQLGPIWVPAGTSGVLELNQVNKSSLECSFQPTRVQGIEVRPRVDASARIQAVLAIALPTGMMLAVYSYLIPFRKKPE